MAAGKFAVIILTLIVCIGLAVSAPLENEQKDAMILRELETLVRQLKEQQAETAPEGLLRRQKIDTPNEGILRRQESEAPEVPKPQNVGLCIDNDNMEVVWTFDSPSDTGVDSIVIYMDANVEATAEGSETSKTVKVEDMAHAWNILATKDGKNSDIAIPTVNEDCLDD